MASERVFEKRTPVEITFGFELEFAIASVPDQFLDPFPDDPRKVHGITRPEGYPNKFLRCFRGAGGEPDIDWSPEWCVQLDALKRDIAKLLTCNGFPAFADCDYDFDEAPDNPRIKDLSRWMIAMDQNISHGPDGRIINYYYWPIKIQSPAYIYNEENKQKASEVLQGLDKVYRTACDLSADVHVHVGNGQHGFDLATLKLFMIFVWTFELQIASIHPDFYMTEKAFSKPISTHSALAIMSQSSRKGKEEEMALQTANGEDILADHDRKFVIDTIMAAESINHLVQILSSPRLNDNRSTQRLTYSICNLETDGEEIKKTIEFRQHKSTLDGEEVYHWLTVCGSLIHFANTVDEETLIDFCKDHINKPVEHFSITEVLMAINRPAQAYYYGIRVAEETRKKEQERFEGSGRRRRSEEFGRTTQAR